MKRGKNYKELASAIDADKSYDVAEAAKMVAAKGKLKFDATVELHVNCNLDTRHADQMVRKTIILPEGTGKTVKVAVFCGEADEEKAALDAGADFVGGEDLIKKVIEKSWTDFDIAICTPGMMKNLAKAGRVLGTKGLMPNPKAGTVTADVGKAVKDVKGGRVEFRTDSYGIIHTGIGKVSFGAERITTNLEAILESIKLAKPTGCKGAYITSAYLTSSMGPSIKINL